MKSTLQAAGIITAVFMLIALGILCQGCNLETELTEDCGTIELVEPEVCYCPPQDIVEWFYIPGVGFIPYQTDKGSYNEVHHSVDLFKLGMGCGLPLKSIIS